MSVVSGFTLLHWLLKAIQLIGCHFTSSNVLYNPLEQRTFDPPPSTMSIIYIRLYRLSTGINYVVTNHNLLSFASTLAHEFANSRLVSDTVFRK